MTASAPTQPRNQEQPRNQTQTQPPIQTQIQTQIQTIAGEVKRGWVMELLAGLKNDPIRFNEIALGRAAYWGRQQEVAERVAAHKNAIIATGNSIGKSYLAAGLLLWWLYTRPHSLVIATAPSQTLLGTVLFKEVRKAIETSRRLALRLPGRLSDSPRTSPQVLEIAPGWGAIGLSTRGVERLSGQHNPNLLVIVDEASGVEPEIWEAIFSLNPSKIIAFGNPLQSGSVFHKLYLRGLTEAEDESIPSEHKTVSLRISSTESPDINVERSNRGLADQGFLREAEKQWGRGSPLWRSHVEGLFPEASALSLVEPYWVDRCAELGRASRPRSAEPSSVVIAIDPSAGVDADRTAIVVRDARGILEFQASSRISIPEAALRIDQLVRKHRIPQDRIIYDASGIGRDLRRELELYRLNQAYAYFGAGSGGSQFANLRSTCGWKLRNRLDPARRVIPQSNEFNEFNVEFDHDPYGELERCSIPWLASRRTSSPSEAQEPFLIPPFEGWELLREELIELRYEVRGTRIALEAKPQLKKRLGRSPDLADALLMSFAFDDD